MACHRFSSSPLFTLSVEGPPSTPPNLRALRERRLPRPGRGVEFPPSVGCQSRTTPGKPLLLLHEFPKALPPKPFRINAHFPRFCCHVSTFRMNTSKSVSKQRTLSVFRINTFEKQGRGWPVIVNQESERDSYPEESAAADDDSRPTDHGPRQFRVSIFEFRYVESARGYFNTTSGRLLFRPRRYPP